MCVDEFAFQNDLSKNNVIILSSGRAGTQLQLLNGVQIIVRVFESFSAAENVMFLIESK